jgi:hypothetical protein
MRVAGVSRVSLAVWLIIEGRIESQFISCSASILLAPELQQIWPWEFTTRMVFKTDSRISSSDRERDLASAALWSAYCSDRSSCATPASIPPVGTESGDEHEANQAPQINSSSGFSSADGRRCPFFSSCVDSSRFKPRLFHQAGLIQESVESANDSPGGGPATGGGGTGGGGFVIYVREHSRRVRGELGTQLIEASKARRDAKDDVYTQTRGMVTLILELQPPAQRIGFQGAPAKEHEVMKN